MWPTRDWKKIIGILIGLAMAATAYGAVETDTPNAVETALTAELRVPQSDNSKAYRFVRAQTVQQGEEIFYTVKIHNPGMQTLSSAVIVQPIPANTHYIANSATGGGAKVEFSTDGGYHFAEAANLSAPYNSTTGRRITSYTHIRWTLQHPLPPKSVLLARFRVEFQ